MSYIIFFKSINQIIESIAQWEKINLCSPVLTIKSFNEESLVFHLDQFHEVANILLLLAFPSIPLHAPKQKKEKSAIKRAKNFIINIPLRVLAIMQLGNGLHSV